jgi:hypothetical protein
MQKEIENNQVGMHPDYLALLNRYSNDLRFGQDLWSKQECIRYLTELNTWVQTVSKPAEIRAILLTGSFSHLNVQPPNLQPVIDGPITGFGKPGGSDIDLLFLYQSNIKGLLNLKWLDLNVPERELTHPQNFVVNTRKYFQKELCLFGNNDLTKRVEMHVVVLTPELGEVGLKGYVKSMIKVGTLIWGEIALPSYGTYREKPLRFKRPGTDSILDQMGGGF